MLWDHIGFAIRMGREKEKKEKKGKVIKYQIHFNIVFEVSVVYNTKSVDTIDRMNNI